MAGAVEIVPPGVLRLIVTSEVINPLVLLTEIVPPAVHVKVPRRAEPVAMFPPDNVPTTVRLFTMGLSVNPGVLLDEVALFSTLYAGSLASVSANVPLVVMVEGSTANIEGTVIPMLVTVPAAGAAHMGDADRP
jgi:hypothetical protein